MSTISKTGDREYGCEKALIDKLYDSSDLNDEEIKLLLEADDSINEYLFQKADSKRQSIYGKDELRLSEALIEDIRFMQKYLLQNIRMEAWK